MGLCFRSWPGLAFALCCAACAASEKDPLGDQGATELPATGSAQRDELDPGTHRLRLQTDMLLRLSFGESGRIAVLLTDDAGAPIEGDQVSFALIGRAQDASLKALDVTSDAGGLAENQILAGRSAAAFAVRVSAPGAYDLMVDVAVSDAGFGTLKVNAGYTGARSVSRRIVFARAGAICADAERMAGDPMVTLGEGELQASFLALPAAVNYAVTAVAESENGSRLARGCAEGALVRADRETEIDLTFTDEPLLASGRFMLDAQLDTAVPAVTLTAMLRSAAETLVRSDSLGNIAPEPAQGRFLLDSLDGALRAEPLALDADVLALADALAQVRAVASGQTPDQTLQALLEVNGEGPLVALPRIVELAAQSLKTTRLLAELTLAERGPELPVIWQTLRVEAAPVVSGGAPLTVDASALAAVDVEVKWLAVEDRLVFSSVRLNPQFGALAAQVLRKILSFDETGYGADVRALAGCPTLEEWLRKQSFVTTACDAECVTAACDRALARIASSAETALLELDRARPTLALAGELQLHDQDGDLQADQMSTEELFGAWEAELSSEPGDPVSGPATATALAK